MRSGVPVLSALLVAIGGLALHFGDLADGTWEQRTKDILYVLWWGGWKAAEAVAPWDVSDRIVMFDFDSIEFFVYVALPCFGTLWLMTLTTACVATFDWLLPHSTTAATDDTQTDHRPSHGANEV